MTLTYIWTGFFLVGFLAALAQWLFLGDVEVFKRIIDGTFTAAKVAVMDIALPLAGIPIVQGNGDSRGSSVDREQQHRLRLCRRGRIGVHWRRDRSNARRGR